uniref:Uncharacterized protein n=1 Tax=Arundo donax TaxID=35708 RepID=A0A0A8ZPW5_ARUDO
MSQMSMKSYFKDVRSLHSNLVVT